MITSMTLTRAFGLQMNDEENQELITLNNEEYCAKKPQDKGIWDTMLEAVGLLPNESKCYI